ncbi:MAG: Protease 3 precursor [Firmicutes bacterium ADurb.Bin182]|nr:MAG: Protease 3 precursor [Firmicutes bacterium ADurb.Bin182]
MIYREKLDNGIRIILEQMPSFRSVSMGVWIATGSIKEVPGEEGASHFIEHMLFKGTEKRSASEIAVEMDSLGGTLNAFTSKECTCFYAKVLDEHMENGADILADIVRHSKFDESEIEKEKGVVCEEILMVEDNPEELVHELLCKTFYADDPLAKPILGTESSVRSFTREKLLAYMDKHYIPSNIVIACAGNFETEKLLDTLKELFGSEMMGRASEYPESFYAAGKKFQSIEKDIEQMHVALAMPGFSIDEEGQYPLFVLNNVIGGSMSSRLFQKIREQKGLAYSVYSYPSSYRSTGYFSLYAGTNEKQADQVVKLMLDELEDIRRNGISRDELERSKNQLKGGYMLGQESTSGRMNAIGKSELLRGVVYTEEEIMQRIERVSMDDVIAIVPHVLDESNISGAFVGRMKNQAASFEKLLT